MFYTKITAVFRQICRRYFIVYLLVKKVPELFTLMCSIELPTTIKLANFHGPLFYIILCITKYYLKYHPVNLTADAFNIIYGT